MSKNKIESESYRRPGKQDMVPEYVTTVGVVNFCDSKKESGGWTGWHSVGTPDPVIPPGPYKWKLIFTNTELIQQKEYKKNPTGKNYDVAFIAIIWTWRRED